MDLNSVLKKICGRVLVGYLLKLIEDLWTGLRMEVNGFRVKS